jgi:hypothetical protein
MNSLVAFVLASLLSNQAFAMKVETTYSGGSSSNPAAGSIWNNVPHGQNPYFCTAASIDAECEREKNIIRAANDIVHSNESTDSFRSNADQILANLKGAETNSGRQVIYLDNIPDPSDSELPYQPKSHDNDLRNELLKLEKDLYKIGPELKFNKHKNA